MTTKTEQFVEECLKYINSPYIWGGKGEHIWSKDGLSNNPFTPTYKYIFDCSGLISYALFRTIGIDIRATFSSQMMYDRFPRTNSNEAGTLFFYGKDGASITHIDVDLGRGFTVGASGGTHETTTPALAFAHGAKVRASFQNRKDKVGQRRIPLDKSEMRL